MDVPDTHKDLVITMLLDFLQLEVVKDAGPLAQEAEVPAVYEVRRRADVED